MVVSIGGSDFEFGSVLATCSADFVATVLATPSYCKDDRSVAANFAPRNVAKVTSHIAAALTRIRAAMREAGDGPSDYAVVVDSYLSPLPSAPALRYREDLLHRFVLGGCPVFDVDANWANRVVLVVISGSCSGVAGDPGGCIARRRRRPIPVLDRRRRQRSEAPPGPGRPRTYFRR